MILVKTKCIKTLVAHGRDVEPEECFFERCNYFFIYNTIEKELSTINEIGILHCFDYNPYGLRSRYFEEYFEVMKTDHIDNFNLDEITYKYMEKLGDRKQF